MQRPQATAWLLCASLASSTIHQASGILTIIMMLSKSQSAIDRCHEIFVVLVIMRVDTGLYGCGLRLCHFVKFCVLELQLDCSAVICLDDLHNSGETQ
eukprot:1890224-Pleurochrysis_carterae.AAC.1